MSIMNDPKELADHLQTMCRQTEQFVHHFRKKPIVVDARGPLTESEMVTTAHGRVRAEAGDWILSDPSTNDMWPIKPDIFAATYEEVTK